MIDRLVSNCSILTMTRKMLVPTFLLCLALPCFAYGQEQTDPGLYDKKTIVFISDRSHADESSLVFEAISIHMGNAPAKIQNHWLDSLPPDIDAQKEAVTAVLDETGVKAVIWCDFSGNKPSIFFYSNEALYKNVVVRTIEDANPSVMAETFAVIVRAWMTALSPRDKGGIEEDIAVEREGEESGPLDRDQSPELSKDVHLEEKQEQPSGSVNLETAFVASVVSSDFPFKPGLSIGVGFRFLKYWQLMASYQLVQPIETVQADVHLTLRRHPFWLQGRFTKSFSRASVGAGLTLGLDYATETHDSEIAVGDESAEMRASIAPIFLTSVRLVSDLSLFVHLGAEIFLSQARYIVVTSDEPRVVLKPWPVQPVGLVGLSYEFL